MQDPRKQTDPDAKERDDGGGRALPVFAQDGTDLTLIRWMLSLTPEERLKALQTQVQFINQVRAENGLS